MEYSCLLISAIKQQNRDANGFKSTNFHGYAVVTVTFDLDKMKQTKQETKPHASNSCASAAEAPVLERKTQEGQYKVPRLHATPCQ